MFIYYLCLILEFERKIEANHEVTLKQIIIYFIFFAFVHIIYDNRYNI
jgi:hypothetical protein